MINDILRNHAELIKKFTQQCNQEEITKSGEAALVDTVRELNVSLNGLDANWKGPKLEQVKMEVKNLIKSGLLLVKANKSSAAGMHHDPQPKSAFQLQVQVWKEAFMSLREWLLSSQSSHNTGHAPESLRQVNTADPRHTAAYKPPPVTNQIRSASSGPTDTQSHRPAVVEPSSGDRVTMRDGRPTVGHQQSPSYRPIRIEGITPSMTTSNDPAYLSPRSSTRLTETSPRGNISPRGSNISPRGNNNISPRNLQEKSPTTSPIVLSPRKVEIGFESADRNSRVPRMPVSRITGNSTSGTPARLESRLQGRIQTHVSVSSPNEFSYNDIEQKKFYS